MKYTLPTRTVHFGQTYIRIAYGQKYDVHGCKRHKIARAEKCFYCGDYALTAIGLKGLLYLLL